MDLPSGPTGHYPTGTGRANGPSRNVLINTGAVAALILAGVVLVLISGDDDEQRAPVASAALTSPVTQPSRTPTGTPPTSEPSVGLSPSRSAEPPARTGEPRKPAQEPTQQPSPGATADIVPATGTTIIAADAGASLTLPKDWAGAQLEDGLTAAARQIYPDSPTQASRTVEILGKLPDSAILFGIDISAAEAGAAFTPNLNVLVDGSVPAELDLEETTEAELRGLKAASFLVLGRQSRDFGAIEAERVTYRSDDRAFSGVAYIVKENGSTYVLTYAFPSITPARLALAEASASTFSLSAAAD